jgi:hypothetical protein
VEFFRCSRGFGYPWEKIPRVAGGMGTGAGGRKNIVLQVALDPIYMPGIKDFTCGVVAYWFISSDF